MVPGIRQTSPKHNKFFSAFARKCAAVSEQFLRFYKRCSLRLLVSIEYFSRRDYKLKQWQFNWRKAAECELRKKFIHAPQKNFKNIPPKLNQRTKVSRLIRLTYCTKEFKKLFFVLCEFMGYPLHWEYSNSFCCGAVQKWAKISST